MTQRWMLPGLIPARTPFFPSKVSSTERSSIRLVTITSFPWAASLAEAAALAPKASNGAILSGERFQTVRSKPRLAMLLAMAEPILPSPIKATFISSSLSTGVVTWWLIQPRAARAPIIGDQRGTGPAA